MSFCSASTHQGGVYYSERSGHIVMWPREQGGGTDQSDKDSLPGSENESLHRMRTQDPSVGLS